MKKYFGLIGGILQTIGLIAAGGVFGLLALIFSDIGGDFLKAGGIFALFMVACIVGIIASIVQMVLFKKWNTKFKTKLSANILSVIASLFISIYLLISMTADKTDGMIYVIIFSVATLIGVVFSIIDIFLGIGEYKKSKMGSN